MELYLFILLGILTAGGFALIWHRMGRKPAEAGQPEILQLEAEVTRLGLEKARLEERAALLQASLDEVSRQLRDRDAEVIGLNGRLSSARSDLGHLQQTLDRQKADLEGMQETLRLQFTELANAILEEKSRKFTEQNAVRLDEILKPLGEKIHAFEQKVNETYDKESKERFSLAREIRNLSELNQQMSREASNLTNALKGQSKTRGNWGEIILETILEKSGLTRDREFFVQSSFTGPDGRRLQPDVIVAYPGERHVVIDSKVSLVAYERYASGETKEEQDQAAREHLASVRNHITDLSSKNYQEIYALKSLDFVMLFMPVEPAYMLAMQQDPGLWSWAYDRRILLISPTNLIAALRMIANLWRVEYQNKNAMEIARQSGELYDKFASFLDDLLDLGSRLDSSRKAYDTAMNKLTEGRGNLVRRVENLRSLGAKAGKEIPKSILDKSDE